MAVRISCALLLAALADAAFVAPQLRRHSCRHARACQLRTSQCPKAADKSLEIDEEPEAKTESEIVQDAIVAEIDPIDIQILQGQLEAVRNLPRITDDVIQPGGYLRDDVMFDDLNKEPSFRRLFTHDTWNRYNGVNAIDRWKRTLSNWRFSSVSKAVAPCLAFVFCWAIGVSMLLPLLSPRIAARAAQMWIPLSLQGTAIGLLLVFRTNNAYLRLAEAREQWGRLLMLLREVTTKVSVALPYDVACETCRYCCAFTWSLRDKLRDAEVRDDILSILLTEDEAAWVFTQRSRPLAVLSRLRRLLYAEYKAGTLDSHVRSAASIPTGNARGGSRAAQRRLCLYPSIAAICSSLPLASFSLLGSSCEVHTATTNHQPPTHHRPSSLACTALATDALYD